ncbi:uracil-DNA glycosylase family protein [candidate division KSB1 bacterium]
MSLNNIHPDTQRSLEDLLTEIRNCTHCAEYLPYDPNPVLRASSKARLLVVGQAPGTRVHETGIPWNDPSGDRLRDWLQFSPEQFYNEENVAIIPMGYCYPGKGKNGDLPPRKECAGLWLDRLLEHLPDLELTLLIGQYAQQHYLGKRRKKTLTETVKNWREYLPEYFPLIHPSPRNTFWLQQNPWFEADLIPELRNLTNKYK